MKTNNKNRPEKKNRQPPFASKAKPLVDSSNDLKIISKSLE